MLEADNRQSFLDPELSRIAPRVTIGVVGLSGGGSHFIQQFAHVGLPRYRVFDPKIAEEKHLHRLVGIELADISGEVKKTAISKRVIERVVRDALVQEFPAPWEEHQSDLRSCDIVVGCVDSLRARDALERFCRRYLIAYVDVGIDVTYVPKWGYRMAGQVITSLPGEACMWCMGFIREDLLAKEAAEYGDAGAKAQVVWLNGLVASAGVGIVVDLITGKCGAHGPALYLSLDGNTLTMKPHTRCPKFGEGCPHHEFDGVGPARGRIL